MKIISIHIPLMLNTVLFSKIRTSVSGSVSKCILNQHSIYNMLQEYTIVYMSGPAHIPSGDIW